MVLFLNNHQAAEIGNGMLVEFKLNPEGAITLSEFVTFPTEEVPVKIPQLVSNMVNAALVGTDSALAYQNDVCGVRLSPGEQPQRVSGYFIAATFGEIPNQPNVVTNIPDAECFLGAALMVKRVSQMNQCPPISNFENILIDKFVTMISGQDAPQNGAHSKKDHFPSGSLEHDLLDDDGSEDQQGYDPFDVKMDLFLHEAVALVCPSKEDYVALKRFFSDSEYTVDLSVNENGWDDVCKYILYNAERDVVYSRPYLYETNVDSVISIAAKELE